MPSCGARPEGRPERIATEVGETISPRVCFVIVTKGLLPGCAALIEGSNQNVTVSTNPADAQCAINRAGTHLGTINPTPGTLRIDKSKNDLTVTCSKDGFQDAKVSQTPKLGATTLGNIIAGGAVGIIVNAASGANHTYPSKVKIDMAPMAKPGNAAVASATGS